jgi:hypothetical protein
VSTLQERLDRIKAAFHKQASPEALAVVERSNQDLHDSGILERIPRVGDALVPFELPDSGGGTVRSADLLAQGPLVVSFYRGHW